VKYGSNVHAHLAEKYLAPAFFHEGPAFTEGPKFVAMGYMPKSEWHPLGDLLEKPLTRSFADTVINQLQATANALHEKKFVHGDFRVANVLAKDDGSIMIVDFNWSGKSEVVRYPQSLNTEIDWPSTAKSEILECHDHYFVADTIRRIKDAG